MFQEAQNNTSMKDQNKEHLIFIALLFGQLSITAVFRLISDPGSQIKEIDIYWIIGAILMVSCFALANWFKQKNTLSLDANPEKDEALYNKLRAQYIVRLALMEGAVLINLIFSNVFHNEYNLYNALAGMLLYVLMKQSPEEKVVFDMFK